MTTVQALTLAILAAALVLLVVELARLIRSVLCPLCRRPWIGASRDRLAVMRDQRTDRNVIVHRTCTPWVDRPRTVLGPKVWRA
jgi:hypothetical protein